MLWGLSLWGRFTLLEHLFHGLCHQCRRKSPGALRAEAQGTLQGSQYLFHSLCHQCRRKSPGALRAEAQGTLQGSQYLPSMAGAGNSGTRFASMAAFPRCSRMASLPHRCLTASSSSCPDWRASAAPSLSTSVTATSCHPLNDSFNFHRFTVFWFHLL